MSPIPSLTPAQQRLVARALRTLETALARDPGAPVLHSPDAVHAYLRLRLGALPHEVFVVLYLDAQNRLIDAQEAFRGSLTQTAVYPRELVKEALRLNAAAVIVAHNHPSGAAEPSAADLYLTGALKRAFALLDIALLDHVIVTAHHAVSLAATGQL